MDKQTDDQHNESVNSNILDLSGSNESSPRIIPVKKTLRNSRGTVGGVRDSNASGTSENSTTSWNTVDMAE